MPRSRRNIEFEGYFAEGVLGIFKIIRGFADMRDLSAVSVPYKLSDAAEPGRIVGYQRQLNEKHAFYIDKYLIGQAGGCFEAVMPVETTFHFKKFTSKPMR